MPNAGLLGALINIDRIFQRTRRRFLAVNVLTGVDRFAKKFGAQVRTGRIEKQCVVRIGYRAIEVGGPSDDIVFLRQCLHFAGVAPNEDRVGHDGVAVVQLDATLFHDGEDGSDQVLVGAHASRDAVHDDA